MQSGGRKKRSTGEREGMRRAYLVRFWQVRSEGQWVWRGSVEDAHTGEKKGFSDPAGLLAFLLQQLDRRQEPESGRKDGEKPG